VLPGGRRLLGTTPLGMADLVAIGAGVLGPLVINEFTKPKAPKAIQALESKPSELQVTEEASATEGRPTIADNREQEALA